MRRMALCGTMLLAGCSGFPHFLGDTSGLDTNRNAPLNRSETDDRVRGLHPDLPPLRTVQGDVWPGPFKPDPTLADLERDQTGTAATLGHDAVGPGMAPPRPADPVRVAPVPGGRTGTTAQTDTEYQNLVMPNGKSAGIAIPNGNGTSTVIAPNGDVSTVSTPR